METKEFNVSVNKHVTEVSGKFLLGILIMWIFSCDITFDSCCFLLLITIILHLIRLWVVTNIKN